LYNRTSFEEVAFSESAEAEAEAEAGEVAVEEVELITNTTYSSQDLFKHFTIKLTAYKSIVSYTK